MKSKEIEEIQGSFGPVALRALAVGAQSIGAIAVGAVALSAVAIGFIAIGRLVIGRAKIFASCYALFSGLAFIGIVSVLLAPFVHRLLHRVHAEEREQ